MKRYNNINNSYESDSRSSSGSSQTDCNTNRDITEIAKPARLKVNGKQRKESKKSASLVVIMTGNEITSSAEDFEGFRSSDCQMVSSSDRNLVDCPPYTDIISLREPIPSCGSEEISDQDIACQRDMKKMADNLNCLKDNADLLNISQFSIEPSSNPSEDAEIPSATKEIPIIFSVNENSSNAVDNSISETSCCLREIPQSALSFNGKILNAVKGKQSAYNDFAHHEIDVGMETEVKTKTPDKIKHTAIMNHGSPDIFADDDDEVENEKHGNATDDNASIGSFSKIEQMQNTFGAEDMKPSIKQIEKRAMKDLQNQLSGVYPPPSVTIIGHDITNLLTRFEANKSMLDSYMNQSVSTDHEYSFKGNSRESSGYYSLSSDEEAKSLEFNAAMEAKNFGILYNRTDYSEQIEMLHMRLAERHVGQETGSSYTYLWPSNNSKAIGRKSSLLQSPGNRLSHLARRRAVFSSANLLSNMQNGFQSKLGRKPCVIDASKLMKKEKSRTPKRRTPGRRRIAGRMTPSSSKKRFGSATKPAIHILPQPVTATRESSKRALFQSPAQEKPKVNFTPEIAVRVEKSKRALFSPPKRQDPGVPLPLNRAFSDVSLTLKRKRDESDENLVPRPTKIAKNLSSCAASSLKLPSNEGVLKSSSESSMNFASQQLSSSHKQKLLWAVSTALKKKSITSSHNQFKNYASTLAKVVKRLYLESLADIDHHGGTSATMLRLADKLVFWVIQGKTVDEIYIMEKTRMENTKNINQNKLTGYIAPEDFENRKSELRRSNSNVQSENSFPLNQSSKLQRSDSNLAHSNPALVNSSSKNNFGTNVLRENHDSRSAQKNAGFSGKDQKNVSPYNDKVRSANSNKQNKLLIGGALNSNLLKVKRQISFDS